MIFNKNNMEENKLKAINTFYKGVYFRSRLEARWAIFFDSLEIEWEYETAGFDLEGIKYLPDFWLPTFNKGMYVEVKPKELTDFEFEKASRLAILSNKSVWLAVGLPAARHYQVLHGYEGKVYPEFAIPLIDDAYGKNEMFYGTHIYVGSDGFFEYEHNIPYKHDSTYPYNHVLMAVNAARMARFEHGETPL